MSASEIKRIAHQTSCVTTGVCLSVIIMLLVTALSPRAWALDANQSHQVTVWYEQQYLTDRNESRCHRGVDITYCDNEDIPSVITGVISFAGKIPTDAGGRVQAVTVTTASGDQVTLQPFSSISVAKGQSIEKGDLLGKVAPQGDVSSKESHVHVSLRTRGVYRNPEHLAESLMECSMAKPANPHAQHQSAAVAPSKPRQSVPTNRSSARSSTSANASLRPMTQGMTQPKTVQQSARVGDPASQVGVPAGDLAADAPPMVDATHRAYRMKMANTRLLGSRYSEHFSTTLVQTSDKASVGEVISAYVSSLSQLELFTALFISGIALPCAGIGLYTIGSRMGMSISSIRRIVAARDE